MGNGTEDGDDAYPGVDRPLAEPPQDARTGLRPVLDKFAETVRVFASARPSVRALLESRTSEFDRAHVIVPSTVVAGETVELAVQAWDRYERLVEDFDGWFEVETTDPDADVPSRIRLTAAADGHAAVDALAFATPGIQYVTLHRDGERFVSNPIEVHDEPPDERLYWGDIHCHSRFSDGAGSVDKGLTFAREVMRLDVAAYTDHDTMGFFIPPQLQRRRMARRYLDRIRSSVDDHHEPGEFVALFGYEYTKQPNVGGHVNVYFDRVDDTPFFDSLNPESNTYELLWERLREWRDDPDTEGDVVTIPHHPAEGMYPFDFASTDYDDELAPLVEGFSQWGSSIRPGRRGNPFPLAMGQGEVDEPGHYVEDALALGNRVGIMASSDYHGPHPGHALLHADPHLPRLEEWLEDGLGWGHIWRLWNEQSYPGGLVAFRAPELTRSAVFDALQSRRVYGTTQPHRIALEFSVNGVAVGENDSTVAVAAPDADRDLSIRAAGTAPIERLVVVKNNETWLTVAGTDDPDADLDAYTLAATATDTAPVAGLSFDDDRGTDDDVYYARVEQVDAGTAWAGPLWATVEE